MTWFHMKCVSVVPCCVLLPPPPKLDFILNANTMWLSPALFTSRKVEVNLVQQSVSLPIKASIQLSDCLPCYQQQGHDWETTELRVQFITAWEKKTNSIVDGSRRHPSVSDTGMSWALQYSSFCAGHSRESFCVWTAQKLSEKTALLPAVTF